MSTGYPAAVVPTVGIDLRTVLATNLHASPGVYAVLVGSGMSTAAGILTGWKVVLDLIGRVAAAEGVELGDAPGAEEEWWTAQGRGAPRYDTLLQALSLDSNAARQALLRKYFDPQPGEGGPVLPTQAHRVLAQLCASGTIRLILTTNFDHLIERALDEAGVTPQVIVGPSQVASMRPLPHPGVTVVKLHGDYTRPGSLRNTPEELNNYPPKWRALLSKVFDEFGLVVIGWSAEWDTALVDAWTKVVSRRYPVFWASYRGSVTEEARRLIDFRQAAVIDTDGADSLLGDVSERLDRLDRIATRGKRRQLLGMHVLVPGSTVKPNGWAVLPLLQVRVGALLGAVTRGSYEMIRRKERQLLCDVLTASSLTNLLGSWLHELHPASALVVPIDPGSAPRSAGTLPPLSSWGDTPGDPLQSGNYASFRFGGDARAGTSALVTVTLPTNSEAVQVTLDVALSVEETVAIAQIAKIFHEGLV